MAATVQTKTGDVLVDMNTTPLIDVMLVLLTLLIITLPMQTNAVKIDLPHQGPRPLVDPEIVTLAIDFDGVASWNGQTISRATLNSYLFDAAHRTPQPEIHIRADKLTKYDSVASVLADAARAGETHVGFDGVSED
jgi:biopolymer transport protein ExbD